MRSRRRAGARGKEGFSKEWEGGELRKVNVFTAEREGAMR